MNRAILSTGRNSRAVNSRRTVSAALRAKHRRRPLRRILAVVAVLAVLAFGWMAGKFIANSVQIFGWDGLFRLFSSQQLEGEAEGRINILLAGNSADDPGHEGAELTDSIMILSINTRDNEGYVLSIPRDLYVDIPGKGHHKINEAYQVGQERSGGSILGDPDSSSGMGLLKQVIARNLGMRVHYYALVNYEALRQAVDAVDGIEVNIASSDIRGLYDPSLDLATRQPLVKLPNGVAHLDGRQALNLARARGHADGAYGYDGGDFMRTELQRQILMGIKHKSFSVATLSNPLRIGKLFDSLGGNIETDLSLGEVRRLHSLTQAIDDRKVTSATLNGITGDNLLEDYTTPGGQYALVPRAGIDDYSEIREYIESLKSKH